MVETPTSQLWLMRLAYLVLGFVILGFQLVPLQTLPRNWAGPDLLLAVTCAWALRRPDYVPALSVAGLILFADLMLHRPPGLMAALVLVSTEFLKRRALQIRDEGFVSEMLLICTTVLAVTLLGRLILSVMLVPRPSLGLTVFEVIATLLAYPIVVLISNLVFGVRVRAPGEDATGSTRI